MTKKMVFIPGEISKKWDNLSEFEKLKNLSLNRDILCGSIDNKKKSIDISPLAFILNMLEMKKRKILNKLSYRVLITTFSLSLFALIFKLIISKRLRKMAWNYVVSTSFSAIILIGSGSVIAILMKPKNN